MWVNLGVCAHELPQRAVSEGGTPNLLLLRAPVVTWWPLEQGGTVHCHSTCQLDIWELFSTHVIKTIKIKYISLAVY